MRRQLGTGRAERERQRGRSGEGEGKGEDELVRLRMGRSRQERKGWIIRVKVVYLVEQSYIVGLCVCEQYRMHTYVVGCASTNFVTLV